MEDPPSSAGVGADAAEAGHAGLAAEDAASGAGGGGGAVHATTSAAPRPVEEEGGGRAPLLGGRGTGGGDDDEDAEAPLLGHGGGGQGGGGQERERRRSAGVRRRLAEAAVSSRVALRLELALRLVQSGVALIMVSVGGAHDALEPQCTPQVSALVKTWILGEAVRCALLIPLQLHRYGILVEVAAQRRTPRGHISFVTQLRAARADRLKGCADFFWTAWFLLGNIWLDSTGVCPLLHSTMVALLAVSFVGLLAPFLAATLICACLPCLMASVQRHHEMLGAVAPGAGRGASAEVLSALPTYEYGESGSRTFDDEADASCCICLCEYENGETLTELECGHHFHKSCLTEWATINASCPLCKRGIGGAAEAEAEQQQDGTPGAQGLPPV